MSTGLFPSRERQSGPRKGYIPLNRRSETAVARKSRLAEAMAEGAPSVAAAAKLIGISQQAASRHWIEICDGLGRQAR